MIAALVCGRAEDHGFVGRNTFPLLGRPLMVYPLLAALHSAEVAHTYLSTDDTGMARVGQHTGAEIIMRPPELGGASVSLEVVIEHGYREIVHRLGSELEALVVLIANAPTVTDGLIDQGVEILRANPALDEAMTVSANNEFHPRYALKINTAGLIRPYSDFDNQTGRDAYFPDSLLWVLRPARFFDGVHKSLHPNWLFNTATHKVAPLVHEGYGAVNRAWQIPAIEEWLYRRGFSETATPYAPRVESVPFIVPPQVAAPISAVERKVLITTVPFGQTNRYPLDMLETDKVEYVINPIGRRLKEEELAKMIGDFGILIAGTEPITAKVMEAAPHLRLISRVGIGLDNVDLNAARARNIQVTYTPDAPSPAVAELTIGLMLSLLRDIAGADRNMRNGIWHRFMGRRLSTMTVGVIGVGRVGKRVIQHLVGGFPGVHILANDLQPDIDFGCAHNVEWTEKERIYSKADIITLHLPLTPLTRRLITSRQIATMQPGVLLVNTSRGNMIYEHDLAEALRSGYLGGAALDVYEREPYSGELATLDRCLLTCHMGSMSQDCRQRMELEATEDVVRFLKNEPLQRLVPESEYQMAGAMG